jgi:uncharacterized damage-inducible protein DinB
MKKERVLNQLENEWQAFFQSFAELPDDVLIEPDVVGIWSIRDVLAHMSTWEEEALKALPRILEGKRLPRYGSIDAFNAREQERRRSLSLAQVKGELDTTHRRLIAFLESLSESAFTERFVHRLRLDTLKHYREHAGQIAAWRQKKGF